MEHQTFLETWTVDFVKRVLHEYEQYESDFLCICSPTFASIWYRGAREHIAKLALDFHKNDKEVWNPGLGGCLFYLEDEQNDREVRLEFLKHEIKRLTTN